MGRETKIEWADHTWNPWRGCQHATLPDGTQHPGCTNCYAETMAKRFPDRLGLWGPDGTRVMAAAATFAAPLKWNRAAEKAGERRRVFVDSLSDFFEDWRGGVTNTAGERLAWYEAIHAILSVKSKAAENAPVGSRWLTLDDLRREVFGIIDACPWLDFLILTKRPGNIRRFWPTEDDGAGGKLAAMIFGDGLKPAKGRLVRRRDNTWLLYSASDQASLDAGLPELLKCRDLSPVLGISAEPLIGPLNLRPDIGPHCKCYCCPPEPCDAYLETGRCPRTPSRVDWLIVGGESGNGVRPFDLQWARTIIRDCKAAGVPCFLKQIGSRPVDGKYPNASGLPSPIVSGNDSKGGDWAEWPNDLPRVRQFPEVAEARR